MNVVEWIAYILAICFLVFKAFTPKVRVVPEEDDDVSKSEETISFNTIEEYINSLNQLKQRLDIIEQMITDIEVCSPDEEIKGVKVSIPNNQGNYNNYNFIVNGKDDITSNGHFSIKHNFLFISLLT
jgi:hypothetical protein